MVAYTPNYTDQARAVLPLAIEVARGRNDDFSLFTLQMYNGAVINAVETLWPESTRYSAWLTTLTTMTISSSSASDAAAGTGARTVTITGLDSNFNQVFRSESTRYSAWLTTLTTMTISSSSASDAAAGTGARTVTITGLDSNFNQVSSTVTLNGTTAVTIPVQLRRVNFIKVVRSEEHTS